MDPLTTVLFQLWNGQLPLWVAFWVWGQGVYALLLGAYIAIYAGSFWLLASIREKFRADESFLASIIKYAAIAVNSIDTLGIIVITIFFTLAIWNCAPNTSWTGWTWLARGYVLVFWMFVLGGAYWLWLNRGGA